MKHQVFARWTLLLGLAVLNACSDGIVSHSYKAKGVDLKQYKTFAWVKPGDAEYQVQYDQKLFIPLIHKLSTEELQAKGFVIDNEKPDAVFLCDTKIEERTSYSQTPQVSVGFGFGGPGYYGGFAAPVAGGDIVENRYQQGMLFIEMYDTKTQKLVWRGWAEEQITYKNDIEADIRTAVKHVFMRLSVKHK
ncbi:DUF4136 domain-containing protein [Oscillatoria amoena NRMC-F 0135]|nr:DUF4136 domain-containing protein [Oscillatoria amoena NRMC-F 0135]